MAIDFTTSANGRDLRLQVALPMAPEPPQGYRVLYLFDGNAYFASAVEAVRANGNAPDVIVVGIGYPDTPEFIAKSIARHGEVPAALGLSPFDMTVMRERFHDLTAPMSQGELDRTDTPFIRLQPQDVGGLDALLDTIEHDIAPRIRALAKVDAQGSALFGHSLGGLAVLHALFTRPRFFRSFIAASPSIWWNDRAVLANEAAFQAQVARCEAAPRVLVTMGSEESTPPSQTIAGLDTAYVTEVIRKANMVGNARDLVDRLKAASGGPGFEVADYAVFDQQDHGLSVWPAIGRAIAFAFKQ